MISSNRSWPLNFRYGARAFCGSTYLYHKTHHIIFGVLADTVFGTGARNADIYDEHAKDVVLSAVSGFNGKVIIHLPFSWSRNYLRADPLPSIYTGVIWFVRMYSTTRGVRVKG